MVLWKSFSLDDFANRRHKIILVEDEAKVLFPEGNAIGKRVTLTVPYNQGRQFIPFSFEVCGVVKPRNRFSSIGSFMVPRSFVAEDMGIGKMILISLRCRFTIRHILTKQRRR